MPSSREKANAAEARRKQRRYQEDPELVRQEWAEQKARQRAKTTGQRRRRLRKKMRRAFAALEAAPTPSRQVLARARHAANKDLQQAGHRVHRAPPAHELQAPISGDSWGKDSYGEQSNAEVSSSGRTKRQRRAALAEIVSSRWQPWDNMTWTVKRGMGGGWHRKVAPVFDARGDGISPVEPAGTTEELTSQACYEHLRTEPKSIQAIALKINQLGAKATEGNFSHDQLLVIGNLVDRHLIKAIPATDLPSVLRWDARRHTRSLRTPLRYHLAKRTPKGRPA